MPFEIKNYLLQNKWLVSTKDIELKKNVVSVLKIVLYTRVYIQN
jgi:hypothetical protein